MGIGVIILLILLGLLLIWLEVLVVPGVTVSGIGGIILMAVGVFMAFRYYGNTAGLWVLGGSFALLIISIVFLLKSNTWKRLSLDTNIDSTVEHIKEDSIKVGDEGKTITRLAPSGKIRIKEQEVEAESTDGLINPGVDVVVTEILKYKVFVKLKTKQ